MIIPIFLAYMVVDLSVRRNGQIICNIPWSCFGAINCYCLNTFYLMALVFSIFVDSLSSSLFCLQHSWLAQDKPLPNLKTFPRLDFNPQRPKSDFRTLLAQKVPFLIKAFTLITLHLLLAVILCTLPLLHWAILIFVHQEGYQILTWLKNFMPTFGTTPPLRCMCEAEWCRFLISPSTTCSPYHHHLRMVMLLL